MTRSRTRSSKVVRGTSVTLNNNLKKGLLTDFSNNQVLCNLVTNLIKHVDVRGTNTGAPVGPIPVPDPVYDPNHNLYKHDWEDAEGIQRVIL